jgi:predicted alpha/beta hydrolase
LRLSQRAAAPMTSAMDLMLSARDGVKLAATLFDATPPFRGALLLNGGTGIARQFYAAFAGHLAGRGFAVLSYDYRGIGGSDKPAAATIDQWGTIDQPSMLDHLARLCPGTPIGIVGHSFGGQVLGLLPNNTEISRALLIAAQAGYWKLMAAPERYRVYAMLNFWGVPLTRTLGYTPAWTGLGMDLPKDAFLQWVSWVMSPRYLFDDRNLASLQNFPNYKGALRALCMSDDPWATRPAVELLCAGFVSAKPEILTITPADAGVTKIGHFGFFRPEHRDTLWRGAAEWIEAAE